MKTKKTLIFQNSYGEERTIGEYDTYEQCYEAVNEFLKERDYKPYYIRTWATPTGRIKIDVGSHTEFFFIKG